MISHAILEGQPSSLTGASSAAQGASAVRCTRHRIGSLWMVKTADEVVTRRRDPFGQVENLARSGTNHARSQGRDVSRPRLHVICRP